MKIDTLPFHVSLKMLISYSILKFHFMFFEKYGSRVQHFHEFPFHVFWKISIPYSRSSKNGRIFRIVQPTSVPQLSKWKSNTLRFPQITLLQNGSVFFLNYLKSFGVCKVKNDWFWDSWSRPLGPISLRETEK